MSAGWAERAACRNADPNLFFRPDSQVRWGFDRPNDRRRVVAALRFCARCPVRAECLDYAHETGMRMGVWGGVDHDS